MEYYYIKINKFWFIFWIIITIILTVCTEGVGLVFFIIPAYYYDLLNKCKYYYNNEKLIIEYGIFNKQQKIIPLYRIINITAQDNIFNFGVIRIEDKGQNLLLKYVDKSKMEMMKLVEKWEEAKKQNIRNEAI